MVPRKFRSSKIICCPRRDKSYVPLGQDKEAFVFAHLVLAFGMEGTHRVVPDGHTLFVLGATLVVGDADRLATGGKAFAHVCWAIRVSLANDKGQVVLSLLLDCFDRETCVG